MDYTDPNFVGPIDPGTGDGGADGDWNTFLNTVVRGTQTVVSAIRNHPTSAPGTTYAAPVATGGSNSMMGLLILGVLIFLIVEGA
jgi:hypothetical protein